MLIFGWLKTLCMGITSTGRSRTAPRPAGGRRGRAIVEVCGYERVEDRVLLAGVVVTGTGDVNSTDGVVTLREAMTSINNGASLNADVTVTGTYGVGDTITFNIPGSGVQTIIPVSPLPTIVRPVDINGYSQTGAVQNTSITTDNAVLRIEINGSTAGLAADGLVLGAGAGGSVVRGLVINRFTGTAIVVQSDGNTIAGNFLGTNAAGNAGLIANGSFGIEIGGSFRNVIGGVAPAARNVIGGNSDGINLNAGSQNTLIQGNFIGVGVDGVTAISNRLHGVALRGNSGLGVQNNEIGGTVAGAGNIIANSGSAGVAVFGDALTSRQNSGNTILGNSIYRNGLNNPRTTPGIDLVTAATYSTDDGVTLNDVGDVDSGPNLLQNFPVLASVTSDDESTTIVGTLGSQPNTTYRVEFFSSLAASATGSGEGQTFLGFTDVTTDASGLGGFNAILPTSVPNGRFVTATATSGGSNVVPVPSLLGSAANFAVLAASTVTITGATALIGDVGVTPGSVINGTFTTTGTVHVADAVAAQAQADLTTAYNSLAAMAPFVDLTGTELGGLTLTPGVYRFNTSAQLTGPSPLRLDTQGDPHALFVFQIGSTLTTAAAVGSAVITLNGPSDQIYWQVGSSATIGVGTAFVGNILAQASITLATGATLSSGRALARTGAVTLDTILADSTTPSQNNTSEFSAAVQLPIPSLRINNVTQLEGNALSSNAIFTVTLSAPSLQTVTVVATSASGTAATPSDYLALPPTTLTFAPGETTKSVIVAITGDTQIELNESYFVNLTSPTNATIAVSQGLGSIVNDDAAVIPPPTLAVNDVAVLEGDAGTINAVFTVTLSAVSAQTVTVVAASADSSGLSTSDYAAFPATTLTFAPGETTKTITVVVNGDTLIELNETFVINLTAPTNATIADNQGIGTILNDDPGAPVIIPPAASITDVVVIEGNSGTINAVFNVSLSAPSVQTVTLVVSSVDSTGSTPADYAALAPITLTFAPGEILKTVTVVVNGDTEVELNETFFVNLTAPTNATLADSQGLGTIVNDDGGPVILPEPTLRIDDVRVLEGDSGTISAVFTVTLSAASLQTVTVIATSADGAAQSTSDYIALPPTLLSFAPGELTKAVSVTVNGDVLIELDETFVINLSSAVNATFADSRGQGTILNDDPAPPLLIPPSISINDVVALEGTSGTSNAVFTVTLSAPSVQIVTVVAASADGTALNPGDYVSFAPTTLTFAPGETIKTVQVAIPGDLQVESNLTFVINLSAPANATLSDSQGVATIIDSVNTTIPSRMYRALNPTTNDHFYTTSLGEFENAIQNGFIDETTDRTGFGVLADQFSGSQPLYRLYNPVAGLHYYTTNSAERDSLVTQGNVFEKVEGFLFVSQTGPTVEILRLYNVVEGSHLYTASAAVRDAILQEFPGIWVEHSPTGFGFIMAVGEGVPADGFVGPDYANTASRLFRSYNAATDDHFYTTSFVEFQTALDDGYSDESTGRSGIGVTLIQYPGSVPLHRLVNPDLGLHYYTANSSERDALVSQGYLFEGNEGFVFTSQIGTTVEIWQIYNTVTGGHLYTASALVRDAVLSQFPGTWIQHSSLGFGYDLAAGVGGPTGAGASAFAAASTSSNTDRTQVSSSTPKAEATSSAQDGFDTFWKHATDVLRSDPSTELFNLL
jgi:hypothetical protein